MDLNDVAAATITWARSAREEDLLAESLRALAATGLRIAVADRGNRPTWTALLSGMPGVSLAPTPQSSLVAQVQASLDLAQTMSTRFVLYTEPDKEMFFRHWLVDFIRNAPSGDDVGIVLAGRSEGAFQTFPPMQRFAEGVINNLCAERLSVEADYCYGPFLIARAVLSDVAQLHADLGWGWRPASMLRAHRRGLGVHVVTGEFACPEQQRSEDHQERTHRLRQLSQNVLGLID